MAPRHPPVQAQLPGFADLTDKPHCIGCAAFAVLVGRLIAREFSFLFFWTS
jgi:hypothetical protein